MKRAPRATLAALTSALALALSGLPAAGQQKTPKAGGAASAAAGPAVAKVDYGQRFAQVCAACHGANGRSETPGVPVIAGQPSLYAITQLFLFREGRRSNEAMTAVAKTLSDEDMRGFADYIGTLPPVPPAAPSTPTDAARMAKGKALASQHQCVICHGADLSGGQQVPRIGGQREEYVKETLHGFKSGKRAGYTQAMTAVVSQIPIDDLDTLAYYVARFSGGSSAAK